MANNGKSHRNKIAKFANRHPEGRKKYVAKKELAKQETRQAEHQLRGKQGHRPKKRKVLRG